MERYSRISSPKWQSIYSEEFKRFVCNDYLTGSMTKKEVELKHNLGNGRLTPIARIYQDILANDGAELHSLPAKQKQKLQPQKL